MKKQIGIYKIIEQGDWEQFYKIINEINAGETFWDDIDKYELAELNFICWELSFEFGIGVYKGFDTEFLSDIAKTSKAGHRCYLARFKNDNDLMGLMGYISSVGYSLVPEEGEYLKFEEMGRQMRKDAYINNSQNMFIKYLNTNGIKFWDKQMKNRLRPLARDSMNQTFENCPGIREYFKGILGSS